MDEQLSEQNKVNGGKNFIKAYWPHILIGLALVGLLGNSVTTSQKLKIAKQTIEDAKKETSIYFDQNSVLASENKTLREQISKSGTKDVKKITVFDPATGNKLREEYESAAAFKDEILRNTQEEALKLESRLALVEAENVELRKELSVDVEKETIKRGQFRIGWGFEPVSPLNQGVHLGAVNVIGPVGVWGLVTTDLPNLTGFRGLVGGDLGL